MIGGMIVRKRYCIWSPTLASSDWPARRGYEAVMVYLPSWTDAVFHVKVNVTVDPARTVSETEDAIV